MAEQIIDACCLINLYASGKIKEIIPACGGDFHVSEQVRGESLWIRQTDPNDAALLIPSPIDLSDAIAVGLLKTCRLENADEVRFFAEFSSELDDGEASALAIAKSRGWLVATDDQKAARLASESGIGVITTPELMERWVQTCNPTSKEIAQTILAIERFAKFRPRRISPLYTWWLAVSQLKFS